MAQGSLGAWEPGRLGDWSHHRKQSVGCTAKPSWWTSLTVVARVQLLWCETQPKQTPLACAG